MSIVLTEAETPALLLRLGADHQRIDALLKRLERAGDSLSVRAQPSVWAEVLSCFAELEHYADSAHHPLEDRVFDAVLHKGLTPTERHLVFRGLGQHEDLLARTERLRSAADAAVAGEAPDLPTFLDDMLSLLTAQRRHMAFEEMHMFPLLEARLDDNDWSALVAVSGESDKSAQGEHPDE